MEVSPDTKIYDAPRPASDGATEQLELSALSSRTDAPMSGLIVEQTASQRRTELIRFCALLVEFFLIGWQDGSIGPLLPTIRAHFGLGFMQASTLFILQCCGAALGSFTIFFMLDKLGFGKTLVLGAVLHAIATAVQASAPPFPAFAICSFIVGIGMSFGEATGNGYVGSLKRNGSRKMGLLHAAYGLGAFAAPLAATSFAAFSGRKWAFLYIVTAGIAVCAAIVNSVVFRFMRQEVLFKETNEPQHFEDVPGEHEGTNFDRLKAVLKMPLIHYLALYIGIYLNLAGWVVTFIIDERHGGPDAGYISAGFFGGLMLGRVILLPLNSWVGERRIIFFYAVLTLMLDVIIWRVPSLIGNAVAVGLVGLLLRHEAGRVLPPRLLAGAVGYISGFGIIGGAIVPFITGALATKFEIKIMPIVVLIMTTIMIGVWALALRSTRKPKAD
ncbi:MFS general substrate transporter [Auriculariales sp. MPI-PUGE-AT-0066]|nr:MFS general substrate transporter [Auriculariales sp. MPI-PUGE-AT-0066]